MLDVSGRACYSVLSKYVLFKFFVIHDISYRSARESYLREFLLIEIVIDLLTHFF